LGKSMTRYFLQLGANVMITSRKEEALQQAVAELTMPGAGEIAYQVCDVRDYGQIEEVIKAVETRWGVLHGVLNNAAGNFISPTENLSHRAFEIIVDIVLKGTYQFTLAAGKNWIDKKQKGTFLNIVTTYAWTGSGYVVPSACAKAGVLALTRSLAVEWAKYGIRSNAIAPGPFPTEGAWSRLFPEHLHDKFDPAARIPLGRVGDHQELANLAAYLMSEYSAYINGEVVTIDGGEWLKGGGEFNHLDELTREDWAEIQALAKKK
jgi:NAD(P)-dependent dehydrogenase (short-subunit alcohol dehydrogenase family)